jgi:hypothetical protein
METWFTGIQNNPKCFRLNYFAPICFCGGIAALGRRVYSLVVTDDAADHYYSYKAAAERYRLSPSHAGSGSICASAERSSGGRTKVLRQAEACPTETVLEFVAYFYDFVRDDAEMVRTLDRALKQRYGTTTPS